MTTNNFSFYLQTRLMQTSQIGGQWYSDTSPFSIPWVEHSSHHPKVQDSSPCCYDTSFVQVFFSMKLTHLNPVRY
jgi:hypothetical protein